MRKDATVSSVLEETYHARQDRQNMYGKLTDSYLVRIKREIDAQKYLLSVTEKYKIPIEEVEATKQNLKYWEMILKKEGEEM